MSFHNRPLLPPNNILGNPSSTPNYTYVPPPGVSPDGSILLPGGGGNLVTLAGTWTFGAPSGSDYIILLNGVQVGSAWSPREEIHPARPLQQPCQQA